VVLANLLTDALYAKLDPRVGATDVRGPGTR
jgi:ABC-type dipeptide/oligopeptide/nickel transport system permease component